ncbi:MAG TPA: hypothetical protein VK053_14215 [Jiangellaceae bacterium]|nr:hypothetical protein [Jiangellaceae bacterium]
MLLAALTLLAPLSACTQTATTENTEVVGGAHPAPAERAAESPNAESPHGSSPSPAPAPALTTPAAADGTALAVLVSLEEKGRAPKMAYDRDSFGWRDDLDRNG